MVTVLLMVHGGSIPVVVLVMERILLIVGVYLMLIAVVILRIAVLQLLDVALTASMVINMA